MKFTIIIPTHNSEEYLKECLDSIHNQTYGDYEVLCIDDSQDSTVQIYKEYAKRDLRFKLIQDGNGSYGHKINVGIENAQGEYICILESDDYYSEDALEAFAKVINEYDPDFVDGDFERFCSIDKKKISFRMHKYDYPSMYNNLQLGDANFRALWYRTSAIWSGAYKKNFLKEQNIKLNESPGASYQDTSFNFLTHIFAFSTYHIDKVQYH